MKKTRKEKVLDALTDAPGFGWVDGYELCHPSIGGSEGLRRLRELRAEGHRIEKRLKPNRPEGSTVYQYRLLDDERIQRLVSKGNQRIRRTLTQHTSHGR